ncbi:MAG: hypothetical protein KJ601_07595 [Nanoarchaeota archaeon]|nr:hypothetical protein [Nanoarchaeota archaeon]MBU1704708.1 hypothetical protein [Nanoarchaeota archaeon]
MKGFAYFFARKPKVEEELIISLKVPEKPEIKPLPERIQVICKDCSYKFTMQRVISRKPICPYCGRANLMKDNTTAFEIVRQAS